MASGARAPPLQDGVIRTIISGSVPPICERWSDDLKKSCVTENVRNPNSSGKHLEGFLHIWMEHFEVNFSCLLARILLRFLLADVFYKTRFLNSKYCLSIWTLIKGCGTYADSAARLEIIKAALGQPLQDNLGHANAAATLLLMGHLVPICSTVALKLVTRQNCGRLNDQMMLFGCITGFCRPCQI